MVNIPKSRRNPPQNPRLQYLAIIISVIALLTAIFVAIQSPSGGFFKSTQLTCHTPQDGEVIAQSRQFCLNDYNFIAGLTVGADGIDIDCSNSNLIGGGVGVGINVGDHSNVRIHNCNIRNYNRGINSGFYSSSNTFESNSFSSNLNAIILDGLQHTVSSNNFLEYSAMKNGLFITGGQHSVFYNTFRSGVRINSRAFGSSHSISGNSFYSFHGEPEVPPAPGSLFPFPIYIEGPSNYEIRDNSFYNNPGNNLAQILIHTDDPEGLAPSSSIESNTFTISSSMWAIFDYSRAPVNIQGNTITLAGVRITAGGISLGSSDNANVLDNIISGPPAGSDSADLYGILSSPASYGEEPSSHNTISGNDISRLTLGIGLYGSSGALTSDHTVANNLLRFNNYGILYSDAYNNIFQDNTITGSSDIGFSIFNADTYELYRNYFCSNTMDIYCMGASGPTDLSGNSCRTVTNENCVPAVSCDNGCGTSGSSPLIMKAPPSAPVTPTGGPTLDQLKQELGKGLLRLLEK